MKQSREGVKTQQVGAAAYIVAVASCNSQRGLQAYMGPGKGSNADTEINMTRSLLTASASSPHRAGHPAQKELNN